MIDDPQVGDRVLVDGTLWSSIGERPLPSQPCSITQITSTGLLVVRPERTDLASVRALPSAVARRLRPGEVYRAYAPKHNSMFKPTQTAVSP